MWKLSVERRQDICAILAHASAYFMDVYSQCAGMQAGHHVLNIDFRNDLSSFQKLAQATEVGHILATLIFIAHCYVQDEPESEQVLQAVLAWTIRAVIMHLLAVWLCSGFPFAFLHADFTEDLSIEHMAEASVQEVHRWISFSYCFRCCVCMLFMLSATSCRYCSLKVLNSDIRSHVHVKCPAVESCSLELRLASICAGTLGQL